MYDTAQVCLNGHVITDSVRRHPQFGRKFCQKCGAETITTCLACKTDIQGDYHVEGVAVIGARTMKAPKFCHECGKPYPWTANRIEAAKALAAEIEELKEEDRILLRSSIDDIAADTPMTEVAVASIKKIFPKLRRESADVMKKLLVQAATEAAKKSLWGGG